MGKLLDHILKPSGRTDDSNLDREKLFRVEYWISVKFLNVQFTLFFNSFFKRVSGTMRG